MMLASWHHSDGEELLTSRYNDTPSTLNNAAGKLPLTVTSERAFDNQEALGEAHIMSRPKLHAEDLALPHPQDEEHPVKRDAVYALLIEKEYLKEGKPYMQNISMSKNFMTSCTRIAVDHRMATNERH